jgi:thiamine-monophosphate kinase
MNEFELIARLIPLMPSHPGVIVGPGDDCAVIDLGLPDRYLLFKTDAVVAGVHFDAGAPPEKIGHKALARALSDIAAMAGTPDCALVTIGLARGFDAGFVVALYAGLRALALRHHVAIVGGETTTNPERLLLSVSVLGTVPKARCLRRAGARAGDALFVTGELGGALRGRHLEFEPRLAEARWVAERFSVHAMIDLSDGLAEDLRHLLQASGVGAELLGRAIPISQAARQSARRNGPGRTPLRAALSDGEDFELLFAVAAPDAVPLTDAWKRQFPCVKLSCIGRVTAEPGLKLRTSAGLREMTEHGYVHFQEP